MNNRINKNFKEYNSGSGDWRPKVIIKEYKKELNKEIKDIKGDLSNTESIDTFL